MGSVASYCHQAHGREPGSTMGNNSVAWSRQAWRRDSSESNAEVSSFGPRSSSRYCSRSKWAFIAADGAGANASREWLLTNVLIILLQQIVPQKGTAFQ